MIAEICREGLQQSQTNSRSVQRLSMHSGGGGREGGKPGIAPTRLRKDLLDMASVAAGRTPGRVGHASERFGIGGSKSRLRVYLQEGKVARNSAM